MELFANVVSTHQESYKNNMGDVGGINTHKKGDNSLDNGKINDANKMHKAENLSEKLNEDGEKKDKEVKKEVTKEKLEELTKKLNKEMGKLNPDIEFTFNEKINNFVVNVIDKNTDKVIRKIPSDEAIKIMEKMKELTGALFDEKG
jgi:flagellar protein FlaG